MDTQSQGGLPDWKLHVRRALGLLRGPRSMLRRVTRMGRQSKRAAQKRFRRAPKPFAANSNGGCLVQALGARGIAYRYLRRDEITNPAAGKKVITFRIDGVPYYFDKGLRVSGASELPGPPIHGEAVARFINQKDLVKALLRERGFSVPKGAAFRCDDHLQAESFFALFAASLPGPVCVKPTDGSYGREVHVGIRDLPAFRRAFSGVGKCHKRILIEEMVPGPSYRFLYLAGRVIAITLWRRAHVEGDGSNTIATLVERKNAERRLNPDYARHPLPLGEEQRLLFRQAGHEVDHVPAEGQRIFLKSPPNEDEAVDATDRVHRSYIALVERAAGLLPDLVLCGVDVVIQDPDRPAAGGNHHILEFNAPARLGHHHYPWRGKPRDVAGALLDCLANPKHPALVRAASGDSLRALHGKG